MMLEQYSRGIIIFTGSCLHYCSNSSSFLQVFRVRLSLSLKLCLNNLENLIHSPAQHLDSHSVAMLWCGSDRLLGKDWNGLHILEHPALPSAIPSQSREDSPSPDLTPAVSCSYRWTVWRVKTLLCIIVHESHSDREQRQSCTITPPHSLTEEALSMHDFLNRWS